MFFVLRRIKPAPAGEGSLSSERVREDQGPSWLHHRGDSQQHAQPGLQPRSGEMTDAWGAQAGLRSLSEPSDAVSEWRGPRVSGVPGPGQTTAILFPGLYLLSPA